MPISGATLGTTTTTTTTASKGGSAIGEQCRSNYTSVESTGRARMHARRAMNAPGRGRKEKVDGVGEEGCAGGGRCTRVGEPQRGCIGDRVDAALRIFVLETKARGGKDRALARAEIDND